MIEKIVNFIKYNNFFTLALMFIVLGSGITFAASPEARDTIISSEETVRSIDNTYVIAADVKNYDFGLKITNVTEDDQNFLVSYSYRTINMEDFVWKDVTVEKSLNVSKKSLNGKDLGVFVSEQLGQLVDSQRAYLASVQKIEVAKGQSQKVVSVTYSGLIGKMLGSNDKVFEGYNPVVAAASKEDMRQLAAAYVGPDGERTQSIPLSMQEKITEEIENLLAKTDAAATLSSITIDTLPVKMSYVVGDALDISGLSVTGTYSDSSTKIETIDSSNVTGFDSSVPVESQTLTVTLGDKTATYNISISAADTTPPDNSPVIPPITPPVIIPPPATTTPPIATTTPPVTPPVDASTTPPVIIPPPATTTPPVATTTPPVTPPTDATTTPPVTPPVEDVPPVVEPAPNPPVEPEVVVPPTDPAPDPVTEPAQ